DHVQSYRYIWQLRCTRKLGAGAHPQAGSRGHRRPRRDLRIAPAHRRASPAGLARRPHVQGPRLQPLRRRARDPEALLAGVGCAMRIPLYQVDAFASEVFRGNPAAVCPLESWLPDGTLQAIAAENNLSETAFFVPTGERFGLRWFTPGCEVDLCGHATLASAYVLFRELGVTSNTVRFDTKS